MTRQEIFDKVARHLLTQGQRAETEGGDCVYRAEDGTKCAVGCLIPDELYDPEFEGLLISHIFGDQAGSLPERAQEKGRQLSRLLGDHFPLLKELQEVHDEDEPDEWKIALRQVASSFGLDTKVLDKIPSP